MKLKDLFFAALIYALLFPVWINSLRLMIVSLRALGWT